MAAKFGVFRVSLAFAAFAFVAFCAGRSHAAGSFKLKTTTVNEVSGAWHLFVTVEMARPPAIAHVPMKFLFTKETVFERALVDGHDGPVMNRMVLQNQTPSVESLDVDFADSSGKIFKGTRFDFALTRDRGYEAGEYKVQVRTSDGVDIGSSQRVTLNGDNPVVDRRSITFNAKEKSVKKVPGYSEDGGAGGANGAPQSGGTDEPSTQAQEVAPSGSAAPFIAADAYQKTPEEEVKTRPSGCGCVVAGGKQPAERWGLGGLVAGVAVLAARARRRRT